jgi:hypothetical protein
MKKKFDPPKGYKIGDLVRIYDSSTNQISKPVKISQFHDDIDGGVIVELHIFGFRSWNVQDCRPV